MIHLKAEKSLGQNFLVDPKAHARIVRSLEPQADDIMIEIGPGTGLLTRHLLASPLKKLIAYELDSRAVPELRREFAEDAESGRFSVIEADFLTIDLAALSQSVRESTTVQGSPHGRDKRLRVVGNIPYYITSPILFKLLDAHELLQDATLLVQLEVAERLTAKPSTKEYGIPTVLANFFGEVRFLFKVPAGAFRPVPRVDSGVIQIDLSRDYFSRTGTQPPAGFDREQFRRMVRGLFGMRRKTIRNNLKGLYSSEVVARLEADSLASRYLALRAEALAISDFLTLFGQIMNSELRIKNGEE